MPDTFDSTGIDWSVFDTQEQDQQRREREQRQNNSMLPTVMQQAVQQNPDQYAEASRMAQQTGVPTEAVVEEPQSIREMLKLEELDLDSLSQRSPISARFMGDYENAVTAQDDLKTLEAIEKLYAQRRTLSTAGSMGRASIGEVFNLPGMVFEGTGQTIDAGGRTVQRFLADPKTFLMSEIAKRMPSNQVQDVGEVLGASMDTTAPAWVQETDRRMGPIDPAQYLNRLGQEMKASAALIGPEPEDQSYMTDLSAGVTQALIQVGAHVVTRGKATLPTTFMMGVDQQAERQERTGTLGQDQLSDSALFLAGGATAITEKSGIEGLLNRIPPAIRNQALRTMSDILIGGAGEAAQESVEGVLQDAIERLSTNQDAAIGGGALDDALIGGGVGAVVRSLVMLATPRRLDRLRSDAEETESKTLNESRFIDDLAKLSTESKLNQPTRSPERFSQFIEQLEGEDGNGQVYIDAAQLSLYIQQNSAQNEGDPVIDLLSQKVDEAAALGTSVSIPIQDFATVVAPSPHFSALRDSITLNADTIAPFRLQQAVQDYQVRYNQAVIDAQNNASEYAESQEIFESVKAQLVDTGQVTASQADAMAQVVPMYALSYAKRMSAQTGTVVTLAEAYSKMGLTITGPQTGRMAELQGQQALLQAREVGYEGDDVSEAAEWRAAVQKFGPEGMTLDARMARAREMGFDVDQVLYHGTNADNITEFEIGRPGVRMVMLSESETTSSGVFFSPNENDAAGYGQNVASYFVNRGNQLVNPTTIPMSSRATDEQRAAAVKAYDDFEYILEPVIYSDTEGGPRFIDTDGGVSRIKVDNDGDWINKVFVDDMLEWSYLDNPEVASRMKERGYDSVKVYEPNDESGESFFVIDPSNIRSVNAAFDPDAADSADLLAQDGPNARGYFDPQNTVIRLTEASNLSTFLHEFAHFMYEMEMQGNTELLSEINQWFKRNAGDVAREANQYYAEQTGGSLTQRIAPGVVDATPEDFYASLTRAKADNPNGASLWAGTVDDYRAMQTYTMDEGRAGFAIDTDGNLTGVFKHPSSTIRGAMDTIVPLAIDLGAVKLDAFDGFLTESYERFGFREIHREPFSQEYAPETWNAEIMGTPDVVYMELDERVAKIAKEKRDEITRQAGSQEVQDAGSVRAGTGLLAEQGGQTAVTSREADGAIQGLPRKVGGFTAKPSKRATEVAQNYMQSRGLDYNPPNAYARVDVKRAERIAKAYDKMKHNPHDPKVKAAYEAMIEETVEQYKAVLASGLKVEFIDYAQQGDPYQDSPRMMTDDVNNNNHMWVFSTRDGFGSDVTFDPVDNPLLRETEFTISGQPALVNDLFRVVHDYFGHVKEGVGFRAAGEENAWRAHSAMYSPLARRAMTSETRGQNSWVNYGPHGESNRTATSQDTIFADQKIGLLPEWVVNEGAGDTDIQLEQNDNFLGGTPGPITSADVDTYLDTGTTGDQAKDNAIYRATHEQLARGFEQYLMEGKAPSVEARNIFRKFARWITDVYEGIKSRLNVNLDDEMRQVFDRMLASQEQIDMARDRAWAEPLFTDAVMAGMTEAQYKKYMEKVDESKDEADETLRDKLIKQITRQQEQWWKQQRDDLVAEEMERLSAEPVYRAIANMRDGDIKMDRATLKEMVGETVTSKRGTVSVRIPAKLNRMHVTGGLGLHPDEAAAILGYSSGSELVNDILTTDPIRQVAQEAADVRMLDEHGDIMTDGEIAAMADEAVANESRGKVILEELRTLSRGTSVAALERDAIQAMAQENISRLSMREIQPHKFRAAEVRAASEAGAAFAKGDMELAANAKLRQLMNFYLGREAQKARDEIDKIATTMNRYNRKSVREEIIKAGEGYWEQLQGILERFEFRKSATLKSVDAYNEGINTWAEGKINKDGDAIVLSPAVANEQYKTHWKNVPYGALQGIADTVKNIEHVARYANKLERMGEEIEFKTLVNNLVDSIEKNVKSIYKPSMRETAEDKKRFPWALATLTKVPFLASWLDGGERVGMFHQTVVQPFNDALDAKYNMIREYATPVMEAIQNRSKADIKRHARKVFIPELKRNGEDGVIMGHQVLAIALNTGNAENLRKMILGEKWVEDVTDPDADVTISNPVLQAVLARMTKSDWDLVQLTWDQMNKLYPMLAEVHRETSGLVPPKVEAQPVMTPFGEYAGGYYPLKGDRNRSSDFDAHATRQEAQVESMLFGRGSIHANVTASATQERTKVWYPIDFNLSVIPEHFEEVIHFITHHKAVRETNKLLNSSKLMNAIKAAVGPEEAKQLKIWLNDVAKDGREAPLKGPLDYVFGKLRFGATLGMMGFKASTGIIQTSGILNATAEVGAAAMGRSIRKIFTDEGSISAAWDFALENSKVLRHRTRTMDRELRSAMEQLQGKRGFYAALQETSMKHIMYIQLYMVDLPSWHAGYEAEFARSGDETKAAQYGDWVVEQVQGSGATKDMSTILRNQSQVHKTFMMFMTFFSSLWNMERDIVRGAKSGRYSVTTVAAKMGWLIVLPVLYEMFLRGELGHDEDEDEEDLRVQKFLTLSANYAIGGVPFVRDLTNALTGEFGYTMTPVAGLLERGIDATPRLLEGTFTDEEITRAGLKNVSKLGGAWVGLPGTGQIWQTGEHLIEVMEEGEDLTIREVLFGPDR